MNTYISPIIKASELINLQSNSNLILVDAGNAISAKANFNNQHLAGALYVDLDTDLANVKDDLALGGRHPLPTLQQFSKVLTALGITKNSHVIVYDDKNGANAAARFWWMLKSIGHQNVQVLDGGYQAAVNVGFPIDSSSVIPTAVETYEIEGWLLPQADILEVAQVALNPSFKVIDVRDEERYNGTKEPIDLVAGHIPGAINLPYSKNLDANGFFLPPAVLRAIYEKELGDVPTENTIVHCGSGVTACHTLLAIAYAGLDIPKLYVGSWSEWSRNDKPIATTVNPA